MRPTTCDRYNRGRTRNALHSTTLHVDTPERAREAERAVGAAGSVAVDCEAAGYHRYSDRLCLVQVSTPSRTFVLDPLAVDLTPHLRALEDPGRRVLMHGAAYDLRLLRRDLGIRVARLADTQVAAELLGEPAVGLQALLEKYLGVKVSKRFQKADWARRPLSGEMVEYAAGDTRHLHRLEKLLAGRLRELGRTSWAEEECAWLVRSAASPEEPGPPADPVTRFKAARHLGPRDVTALRAVIAWRDDVARERDRAPFRVASDSALMEVVVRKPASVRQLGRLRGFPAGLAGSRGRALLRALERVERLPPSELSPYPRPRRTRGRPTPEEEAAFERLKAVRNRVAAELELGRGRVMSNSVLRAIAAAGPRSLAALAAVGDVRAWQTGVLGEKLLAALR